MLFGSSGIRSRYGGDLINISLRLGQVVGAGRNTVLLGRDTRTTSPILENAFSAGALSAGARVLAAGVVPTPVVAFCTPLSGTGCMVTASHNPEEYNGLKLFNHGGSSFSRTQQGEVEEAMHLAEKKAAQWNEFGETVPSAALDIYIDSVLREMDEYPGLQMVLDCGNGAGSVATPRLLAGMGVRARCVNCNPSGFFSRPSEPLEEHLRHIGPLVRNLGAAGALVHDGDADRLVAFDSRGEIIPGDSLLILFARFLGAKRVVTTTDASMVIEDVAEVRRTPVGDAFVSEELTRWGDFGGEQSGAWIFPGHSLCPDGPYAAAVFCRMTSEWDIREELENIPIYPMIRRSIPCESAGEVMAALGAPSPTDGIRIEVDQGWYLIRASGTEPKIRVTAEGRTREDAHNLLEKGIAAVREWKKA